MPNKTLTLWGRLDSFNVQKVMWLMGELELHPKHIPAGGKLGGLDTPQFFAMNPHGHVPVLDDGGHIVWESHTILRYLAATYGTPNFWSENPQKRSLYECWMDWMQTVLQPDFLTGVFWNFYRTPEAQRDWVCIEKNIQACANHFILLNTILKDRKFLTGETLNLSDITVGTTLFRYFELDIERPPIPHVEAWYQLLQERPSYQKFIMTSFHHLYEQLN